MIDFLAFNHFISIPVLIFFYYAGVMVLPLTLFYYRDFFKRWIHTDSLQWRQIQIKAGILFVLLFMMAQIVWRIMFEAMIGYFQMREYLAALAH